MTATAIAPQEAHLHPLHGRTFHRIQTFALWRKAWEDARSHEDAMGLLQGLYNPAFMFDVEVILFLFSLADCFAQEDDLVSFAELQELQGVSFDTQYRDFLVETRSRIARKAFVVLCAQFFKPETARIKSARSRDRVYCATIDHEFVREKVLWFFRSYPSRVCGRPLFNFPSHKARLKDSKDPNLQVVLGYLEALIDYVWPNDGRGAHDSALPLRPMLVDVLGALDMLPILLHHGYGDPDKETSKALHRLALSSIDRGPKTVKVALNRGSKAAEVLTLLEARK